MAMGEYSIADLVAAMGGNNGFGGFGGWGGLLIGFLGGTLLSGGGLFGGYGNQRGNVATTEDLASGFNFSALQGKTNDILAAIQGTNQNLSNAVCQLGYQSLDHAANLASKIDGCCCTTQRAVDSVKFDMANYASGLQIAQMQGTQKVLDKLCAMEAAQKDAVIAQQNQRIGQLELNQALCGVIRYPTATTYAVPSTCFGVNACTNCAY